MHKGHSEKGMTLVELLLALALLILVGSGLFSVYWTGNNVFERQSSNADAQYSARTAMQWIVKDVLQATADSEENAPVIILDGGKKLQLGIKYMENKQLKYSQVEYYLDDDTKWLYRDESLKPASPIAENIERVSFSHNSLLNLLNIKVIAEIAGHSFALDSAVTPRTEIP